MKRFFLLAVLLCAVAAFGADPRLKNAKREPMKNGWIPVHLEGTPAEIGFQNGYLLAQEIADTMRVEKTEFLHDEKKDWNFYRDMARTEFWPHVEQEYREELQGIADGASAHGVKVDVWDIVALNAWEEWQYFGGWYNKQKNSKNVKTTAPEHCSAFVATGSFTKGGGIVIGHNNWTSYPSGSRWNIVYDIVPAKGHRILMDGLPGVIHSADDFGMNDAGIVITETTISGFHGWDPKGIPEFVRARKAMQYSESIDDFARIMKEGNNGGYANDWLVADRKTGEVASLELGLKNVTLERTKDGYFVGSNYPINPKLAKEETTFKLKDMRLSPNARRVRWHTLMKENKGKIDVAMGQKFLADHYDSFSKTEQPNERTLCGHIDLSPRGVGKWIPKFGAGGTVNNKVADSAMVQRMEMSGALGHSCGLNFNAAQHIKEHPEYSWYKDILRDMPSQPWTIFTVMR